MAIDPKKAQKILDDVLGLARKAAPQAEVSASLSSGRSANTRFARNEITSAGDAWETAVRIAVALGKRHAHTSTNQTDAASLRSAIEAAARMAKLAPEDPEHMPVLGPQKYLASPAAYDAPTDRLEASVRAAAAQSAISAAESARLVAAGFYVHDAEALALANSAGLRAHHVSTSAEFTTTARTGDGTGSGWAGAISNRAADIEAGALSRIAIDKAVRSAKPRHLEPGRYTVVLEPSAAGELLSFLTGSLQARRADEGRSFFSLKGGGTRVGEKIFSDSITLRSDPTQAETPGAPFDHEGFPLRPVNWIDKGRLTGLVYSRFWAQKQGKAPTGMPNRYHLLGGQASSDEQLLAGVGRGVLITRFWYTRTLDPQAILITGLTRDGVFLIENGQITAPVNNFRFNESPVTMLKNADAMTRRTVRLPYGGGSLRVPGVRTHEFNLASISEAV